MTAVLQVRGHVINSQKLCLDPLIWHLHNGANPILSYNKKLKSNPKRASSSVETVSASGKSQIPKFNPY